MTLSVADRSASVATFRYIEVYLMETLARWVPTSPEMEVKVLFGEHIWDLAQHADALGRRTYELRAPLQHSRRPTDSYVDVLEQLAAQDEVPERLAAVYDVALPALGKRYEEYLAVTDKLMDAPTVRILERAAADLRRMIDDGRELRGSRLQLRAADAAKVSRLEQAEAAVADVVAPAERSVEVAQ